MNFWQAILLGLVQGLTEFLPVSSSAHLFLIEKLLNIDNAFVSFEIALHLATLSAVCVFLWPMIKKINKKIFLFLLLATTPLIFVALFVNPQLNSLSKSVKLIASFLLITAAINYLSFLKLKEDKKHPTTDQLEKISFLSAFKIGLFQIFGILPGISRSGITLYAALSNRINAKTAFQFSFLLSIPAIIGSAIFDLFQTNGKSLSLLNWSLTIPAMLIAFISGLLSLKLLQKILIKNHFLFFALYCLFLGLALLFFN